MFSKMLLISTLLPTAFLQAQTRTPARGRPADQVATQAHDYKSPRTATLIGLALPGAGQFYVGKMSKGLILLGAGIGSLIMPELLISSSSSENAGGVVLLGLAGYLGSLGYGAMTADDDAREHNARLQSAIAATPTVTTAANGHFRVGIAVSVPLTR